MTQLQSELEECENSLSAVETEAERVARKMEEIKVSGLVLFYASVSVAVVHAHWVTV